MLLSSEPRTWSPAQRPLVRLEDYDERFILALGDIATGKTAAALFGFLCWSSRYEFASFGIVALSQILVKQKLWPELVRFCADLDIPVPVLRDNSFRLWGNKFIILSGQHARAADFIQGLSLQGAFIDEVNTIPGAVLSQLNNRLRVSGLSGQKMIMTANPASPAHVHGFHFKKRWYDRAADIGMRILTLARGANPSIDDSFYAIQEKTGTKGSRARALGGGHQWVADSGVVYPHFIPPEPAPPRDEMTEWGLGVDVAVSSVTHALLFGYHAATSCWWICDEWRWDGTQQGQLPFRDQTVRIASWLKSHSILPDIVVYDSANPGFGIELSRALDTMVFGSDKDVDSAIAKTRLWLENGYLRLSDRVPDLFDEIVALTYDESAMLKSTDKITRGSDHGCDAMKDFVFTLAEVR